MVEWAVLAVISGLIGGASMELAKLAFSKIRRQIIAEPELHDLDDAKLVLDEKEFEKLLLYLMDFLDGMDNVAPEVKSAIIGEMIVDRMVEMRKRSSSNSPDQTPAKAADELKQEDLLSQAEFENMWKYLDH